MPTVPFGPWPVGIDNISEATALKEGAVVDAFNGVFKRGGHFQRRFNETNRSGVAAHSSWQSPTGETYMVTGDILNHATYNGTLALTPLATLPTQEEVSYTTVNDTILFASPAYLGSIVNDVVTPLGVELPGAFSTSGSGGARYGVAISFIAGTEEGGLSEVQFVNATNSFTINLPTPIEPRVTAIRVYATPADGEQLYALVDLPLVPSISVSLLTASTVAPATQYKTRMPGGSCLRAWRGRLVVARGHVLHFSDPMNYGLSDSRHGFLQMPERIVFVETLDTGMYVGTTRKVYWLAGQTPKDLVLHVVEQKPAVAGASITMPVADTGLESNYEQTAVWLGANGYCFGMPNGDVSRPVSTVFNLDTLGTTGKLALLDSVLTTVMQ